MDYNQQRRYRSGYNSGRQMNYARSQGSGDGSCGCRQGQRDSRADGRQGQWDRNYDSRQRQNDRNYDNRSVSSGSSCGYQNDGCTYTRQKGHLEEEYRIGMGYIPWQSWNCTYDGHRALMSGTIFPELDKPFCAAGRCRQ